MSEKNGPKHDHLMSRIPGTGDPDKNETELNYLKPKRNERTLKGEPEPAAHDRRENELVHAARVLLKKIGENFLGENFTMEDLDEAGLQSTDGNVGIDIGSHRKDALNKLLDLGLIEKNEGEYRITLKGERDIDEI